jgi:hypothetical protein
LAKSQNTDTASLLYDFISGCLDNRIDISLVTGKGNRLDNQLDDDRLNKIDNRLDKLETDTQKIDERVGQISKKLNDWIEAFSDRLNDCDRELSEKITSLEHRLNALSIQLDSQQDSQKDRQEIDTDSQEIDDMEPLLKLQREASIATSPLPPSPPVTEAIEPAIEDTLGTGSETEIVSLSPSAKKKGLTDSELARHLGIDKSNITRWKQKGRPTPKYQNQWELRGRFWYEKN